MPETIKLRNGKTVRLQPDGTYVGDDGVALSAQQAQALAADDAGGGAAPKVTYREVGGQLYAVEGDTARPVQGIPQGGAESDPSRFLGANGFQWVEGNGADALWQSPDGRIMPQSVAVQLATKQATAPQAVQSSGPTAYQSAQLGMDQQRLDLERQKFDATLANYQTQISQKDAEIAQQQQVNDFLRKKGEFEMEQGLRKEAAETEQRFFTNSLMISQMKQARDLAQTQMDFSAAQFNAQQRAQSERDRMEFEDRKAGRLQSLNKDIGTLAADANDRGAYASTVLANSGWGQQAGALAAGDLRTEDSLQPLQGNLNLRDQIMSQQGPTPYSPIGAPQLPGINLAQMSGMQQGPTGQQIIEQAQAQGWKIPEGYTASGQGLIDQADLYLKNLGRQPQQPQQSPASSGIDLANLVAGDTSKLTGANYVQQKAEGGMVQGAYISGERGPELNIPQPDGSTLVINGKQARSMGIDLKKLMKDGQPNYESGGIFGNNLLPTTGARKFLGEAEQRALSGTPWAGGTAPSAVFASSPGFDPIVTDLLASINALAGKGPAEAYKRNAALLRPAGINESVIGRSR